MKLPLRLLALAAITTPAMLVAANDWEVSAKADTAPAITRKPHPLLACDGPFKPTDESLSTHKLPGWFTDARVGLSMHWGVYAVPGWAPAGVGIGESYAEWYGNKIKTSEAYRAYHAKTYGEKFRYDDFIPMFKAEHFDADAWMRTLKDAGVKYYFITAKHHEGFCLWDTRLTNRNALKLGPKRDLLAELTAAARKHGLKIGFYYSLYEWDNPVYLREKDPKNRAKYDAQIASGDFTGLIPHGSYVDDYMIPQLVELVQKYQPDLLYFDGEWDHPEPYWRMREFAAFYYNRAAAHGREVLLNDRYGRGLRGKVGDLVHVEYGWGAEAKGGAKTWAEWRGLGNSFGYNRNEQAYLKPVRAVRTIADCVSANGNVEFNVGPTADGRIAEPEMALLNAMGAWLKVNGAAIYGAGRSPIGTPAWGRVTHKPAEKKLFLHVYEWPKDGTLVVQGLRSPIKSARLLADASAKPAAIAAGDSVKILLPPGAPDPFNSVVELEYAGDLVTAAPAAEKSAKK